MKKHNLGDLPPHIQYAIAYEAKCIELRRSQIDNYEKKIELLMKGIKPSEVFRRCPPIYADLKFNYKEYHQLKEKHEKHKINRQGGKERPKLTP